jgi:phage-related protein
MRTLDPQVIAKKNALAPGSGSWVWLVVLYINENEQLYITSNNEDVIYNGKTFQRSGLNVEIEDENAEGNLPKARLMMYNMDSFLSKKLNECKGFPNGKATVRLINTDHLTDTSDLSYDFRILSAVDDLEDQAIGLEIGNDDLIRFKVPYARVYDNTCNYNYRDTATCKYSGGLSTCDFTFDGVNGCEAHSNSENFGGLPGLSR